MIEQEGVVIATTPEVIVQVQPQSSCGTCKSGGGCGAGVFGRLFKSRGMRTQVKSTLDLNIGDTVSISLHETVLLQAAILMYLVPVVMMVVFPLFGQTFVANTFNISSDVAAISLGLFGFVCGLFFSRWLVSTTDTTNHMPIVTRRSQDRTISVSVDQSLSGTE